ncbi:MAG: DHHA1 domain-containing protein, partial [Tissierellaceae bacterium]
NETKTTMEDTEGIVSYLREISTVEVAVILKEFHKESVKVSMRSKRYVDVAEICTHFNGGGHKRAAGFTVGLTIEESELKLLDLLKDYI